MFLSACDSAGTGASDGRDEDGYLVLTIHYHTGIETFREEDWPAWQQVFEHTNVRLVGTANPVATNGPEQFNLEAANGFPADIYGGGNLASLFMNFGQQGAFVPLNNYIDEYAPNFARILAENPAIRSAITAPDGNIYHFPTLPDGLPVARTYHVRQDWLDLLEMDIPQNIEEMEAMLVAFRDDIPALIGVDAVIPYFGENWQNSMRMLNFWGARTYGNDSTHVRVVPMEDSDEVYHAWLHPQFLVAIQEFSRWYQEGIIDEEFFTRTGGGRAQLWSRNIGGMTFHFPLSTCAFNDSIPSDVPGFLVRPIAPPVNLLGRRVSENERLPVQPNGWGISHNNQHVIETVKFMDFLYSDMGRTLMCYGAEGITFDFDEDGKPYFLPFVYEQDLGPVDVIRTRMGGLRFVGYKQFFQYEIDLASEWAAYGFELIGTGEYAVRQMPPLQFTAEELSVINNLQPAINTFLDESLQSFVLNDWTLIAGQWDTYVQTAIDLGANELVAVYQAAFERFVAGQ